MEATVGRLTTVSLTEIILTKMTSDEIVLEGVVVQGGKVPNKRIHKSNKFRKERQPVVRCTSSLILHMVIRRLTMDLAFVRETRLSLH